MKILWISPWFGNYRIPVYENLNKLSGGNFYIICSQENTSDLVREKLKATLGDHAVIMSGEKRTTMGVRKAILPIVLWLSSANLDSIRLSRTSNLML